MSGSHGYSGSYEGQDQVNYGRSNIVNEDKHHTTKAENYRPKDQNKAMNQLREEDVRLTNMNLCTIWSPISNSCTLLDPG
ncbi:hypothetical protein GGR52DRAFT_541131 [Hypoxylon sp. FL1284]|nr:hypothetical protein GGR52DRAFT_541131 [Hypoxylon sp. FL1284]